MLIKATDIKGLKGGLVYGSNCVLVTPREDIQTVYDWLKSGGRDGAMGALAATNRRVLILLPGKHTIVSKITFDTDYVDVAGLTRGRNDVLIYGDFATALLEQTADVANFSDFSMYNADSTHGDLDAGTAAMCFVTNAVGGDNTGSRYTNLYADLANGGRTINGATTMSVGFFCLNATEGGIWKDCEGPYGDWRGIENCQFEPKMYRCKSGDFSFGGDGENTGNGTFSGEYYDCVAGDSSYGSCTTFGLDSDTSLHAERCVGGDKCWCIGQRLQGNLYDCVAGAQSFAGHASGAYYGWLSANCYRCTAGGNSFGSGHASCSLSGQLIDCIMTGITVPVGMLQNGRIRGGIYISSTNNVDCFTIKSDSPPPILRDVEIEVNSGGTGIPINAGSAKSANVAGCRFNNAVTGSPTGLGANVTNTAKDAHNVMVDAEPKETLTAAAPALRIDVPTEIDSTSNAVDGTLAAGNFLGQRKTIVMIEASNSSTVTVANHVTSDPEVFTFDAVDEALELVWTGTEWATIYATATV